MVHFIMVIQKMLNNASNRIMRVRLGQQKQEDPGSFTTSKNLRQSLRRIEEKCFLKLLMDIITWEIQES